MSGLKPSGESPSGHCWQPTIVGLEKCNRKLSNIFTFWCPFYAVKNVKLYQSYPAWEKAIKNDGMFEGFWKDFWTQTIVWCQGYPIIFVENARHDLWLGRHRGSQLCDLYHISFSENIGLPRRSAQLLRIMKDVFNLWKSQQAPPAPGWWRRWGLQYVPLRRTCIRPLKARERELSLPDAQ